MGLPIFSESAAGLSRIAPMLLESATRGTVILGIAGVVTAGMRRASAAARYWVWMLGIGGLLVLPVMVVVMPPVYVRRAVSLPVRVAEDVQVRVIAAPAIAEGVQTPPAITASREASGTALEGNGGAVPVVAPAKKELAVAAVETHEVARGAMNLPAAEAVVTSAASRVNAASPKAAIPWTFWLAAAWLAGCVLVLGHMMLGFMSLWVLERRAVRVGEGAWRTLLEELAGKLGIRARVRLLVTSRRAMPMTWGLVSSRLLLPEQAGEWSPEQRRAVLLHELGHVRRRDCLTQCVTQLACALYWFNPLVWIAWHRMQVERERACDDLVLNTGTRASSYADHLLKSATAARGLHFVGAAVAMARPSTLEERVKAILDGRRNRRGFSRPMAVMTVILCAGLLVPVAALRGQEEPDPTGQPQPQASPQGNPSRGGATISGRSATGGRGAFAGGRGGFGGGGFVSGGMGAGTGQTGGFGGMGAAVIPGPDGSPTCALDATIYELHLNAEKIGQIDADDLTRSASSAAAFEKALAELGQSKPLYRAHQSVRLSGDEIRIGTQVPYITNSQVSNTGQTINSVAYREVGAIFNVSGKASTSSMELDLSIQVSVMGDNGVAITDTVKAPMFRSSTMEHRGEATPGQPFVLMSVDAASTDDHGQAVAYIARVNMGGPEFPTNSRGGATRAGRPVPSTAE